ncbi:DUF3558 domain-containing protein [Prauserella halophila]|uniref:DUF3558 domain-containing protein n=1 Tax=Prauserella halophila TaxID=185641 RepID=A0ABN1WLF9_9PSEU|nr:DUF3558 domain-containing protein [Prauserella halophila]
MAVVATACSSESDGQAQPQPSSPAASTVTAAPSSASDDHQELPHSGAPAVTNPLPKSTLNGDPCADALTGGQAEELLGEGVSAERDDLEEIGVGCYWSNQDTRASFSLRYATAGGDGLSADYANAKPKMALFNEVDQVEGFPAVQYKESTDDLMCTTSVGLADEYSLISTLSVGTNGAEEGDDPCEAGRMVMERVVGNLKAKA